MITLNKLLSDYWSQIALIIGITTSGIGYILKVFLSWNLKRKEITFSKVREAKLVELKLFFESYIQLESHLRSLRLAVAQGHETSEKEIRQTLTDSWLKFNLHLTYLKIFLSSDEIEPFEKIQSELENINKKLDFFTIDKQHGTIDSDLIKELRVLGPEVFLKRLPELLNIIQKNLKKDLKID
ncbi:MAG: hypothetical protein HWE21_12785 [Cytophagia bacterium]|nr:hypothetical protein [Cytophagia bacterium]